jgi:heme/copper-type cytochrome/quinol oxidase subunit 4
LLSLIVGIFGSVLPGIEISNLWLVIGVAIIVILNTIITEWFGRHGMSFDTAMKEFIGVALANILIVVAYELFLRRNDNGLDVGATLFFVFLISIIIALYDRYRPIYLRRVAAESGFAPSPTD